MILTLPHTYTHNSRIGILHIFAHPLAEHKYIGHVKSIFRNKYGFCKAADVCVLFVLARIRNMGLFEAHRYMSILYYKLKDPTELNYFSGHSPGF